MARAAERAEPIVISGAGPGGLLSALLLSRRGIPVVLVEKRESDYVRSQIIPTMDDDLIVMLRGVLGERFDELMRRSWGFQIKELERLIRSQIEREGRVRIMQPAKIVEVDKERHTVAVQSPGDGAPEMIAYRHIVCSDGAKRSTLEKIPAHGVEYRSEAVQPSHPDYGVLLVTTPEKGLPSLLSVAFFEAQLMGMLKGLSRFPDPDNPSETLPGWNKPYMPEIMTHRYGSKGSKVYVTCQLPPVIINEKDYVRKQRMIVSWLRHFLRVIKPYRRELDGFDVTDIAGPKRSAKHGVAKDRLGVAAVHVTLDCANTPCVSLDEEGRYAILLGDAYAGAWFTNNDGMQKSLRGAIHLSASMDADGAWRPVDYELALSDVTRASMRSMTDLVEQRKKFEVKQAKSFIYQATMEAEGSALHLQAELGVAILYQLDEVWPEALKAMPVILKKAQLLCEWLMCSLGVGNDFLSAFETARQQAVTYMGRLKLDDPEYPFWQDVVEQITTWQAKATADAAHLGIDFAEEKRDDAPEKVQSATSIFDLPEDLEWESATVLDIDAEAAEAARLKGGLWKRADEAKRASGGGGEAKRDDAPPAP